MNYVDERRFRETKINGLVLKTWPLYEDILNADKIINVPIAKHHSLSKLTMSMKNWMGVIGGSRSHIHQRIDECLVDLSFAIKPTLTVLDAVRILVRNGPQGGNPADVKKLDTVVAGTDQVADRLLRRNAVRHEGKRPRICKDSRPEGSRAPWTFQRSDIKKITA